MVKTIPLTIICSAFISLFHPDSFVGLNLFPQSIASAQVISQAENHASPVSESFTFNDQKCSEKDTAFLIMLGESLSKGETKSEGDFSRILNVLKKAESKDHPLAFHYLGKFYDLRPEIPGATLSADHFYMKFREKSLDENNVWSVQKETCSQWLFHLGSLFYSGRGETVQNPVESFKYFSKAADLGLPIAMTMTGLYLQRGYGTDWNPKKAVEWYTRAISLGDVTALVCLGDCHKFGVGMSENPAGAADLYRRAANLEWPDGMYHLGMCLKKGLGVKKNSSKARKWFEMAAAKGHALSRDELRKKFISSALEKTIANHQTSLAIKIFEKGNYPVNDSWVIYSENDPKSVSRDQPLLVFAVMADNTDFIEYLAKKGTNLNQLHFKGYTPLCNALENCRYNAAQKLLDLECKVDTVTVYDQTPLSLLLSNLFKLRREIRRDRLSKADIDLMKTRTCEIAETLIKKGCPLNPGGSIVLAAKYGFENLVRLMVEKGANVNVTHEKITALQAAIDSGYTQLAEFLVENGAQ